MLGHSIVSQHFMELEGSIPNSQELSTCSYPEPDQSSPHHPIPPLQDPIFRSLGRLSKESVQVRGLCKLFVTGFFFYGEGLLTPRPTPKLEDHPLLSVRGCLFNIFVATLHSWRPFLHPQPKDAPCYGDRHPLNMGRCT
jgi:hypothetical protein